MSAECVTDGCGRPKYRRDWCGACYQRGKLNGTIHNLPKPTVSERFWSKVNRQESCWVWIAGQANGYGSFADGDGSNHSRMVYAHRWAYEQLVGPIADGLHLDHLCRNTLCVNPDHLEPVTPRVNILRGTSPGAIAVQNNRCWRGHEFSPENTLIVSTTGRRQCRECNHRRYRENLARKAAVA